MTWKRTPTPNLVRNAESGVYYLRARIGRAQPHRESLKTTNYELARGKLAKRMIELRATRPPRAGEAPETLWQAIQAVLARVCVPRLKASSRELYAQIVKTMEGEVPAGPIDKITAADLDAWWLAQTRRYKPNFANMRLRFVKLATKHAMEVHAITKDPAKHLTRMRVERTMLELLSPAQFAALVADMRSHKNHDAADWAELVCYTGMRAQEANALKWADIDFGKKLIHVLVTKNHQNRTVPFMGEVETLLRSMEQRKRGPRVLAISFPQRSIEASCRRLGIPAPTRHGLRHMFATRCLESGCPVPTVARWLGHQDGGLLLLRTYTHVGSDHEQRVAAQVKF